MEKTDGQSPGAIQAIKDQLKQEVIEGRFTGQDCQNLCNFARKKGTFMEQKSS